VPRQSSVPTGQVVGRHRLWRRAVLPRRRKLRHRVKSPKSEKVVKGSKREVFLKKKTNKKTT
jgi:hypothetical protein